MLRQFWKTEPILAGAVNTMSTKIKSLEYVLEGKETAIEYASELYEEADFGNGLDVLIDKTVQTLCTQDNGFFWELVGAGNPAGPLIGPPQEVNFLDPATIYRTFDPDKPYIYVDPVNGNRHVLHASRVLAGSAMPQPDELARGIGYSHTSRVLSRAEIAYGITRYTNEKVLGKHTRALLHGKGVTARTLKRALNRTNAESDSEQVMMYEGVPILTTAQGVELNLLTLAGLPDNWQAMDETTLYVYILALDFGVDARELWPATTSGATKADASVQNMKARGKGFADLLSIVGRALKKVNGLISPDLAGEHDFIDDERDKMVNDSQAVRVNTLHTLKQDGAIDGKTMRAIAISEGILNAQVLDNIDGMEGFSDFEEPEEFEPVAGVPPGMAPQVPVEGEDGDSEPPEEEEDPESEDDEEEEDEKLFELKTKAAYAKALRAPVRGLWNGALSPFEFLNSFDSAIRRGLTRAAYAAAKQNGINPEEFSADERLALRTYIANEMTHVLNFSSDIVNNQKGTGKLGPLLKRVDNWARRYDEVHNRFLTLTGGNKKWEWVWDPVKEHCVDCEKLNGRVYRGKVWEAYGINPQDRRLACKGFNCGCQKILSDKRLTPGRPPRLAGQRWSNSNLKQLHQKYSMIRKHLLRTYRSALRKSKSAPVGDTRLQQLLGQENLSSMSSLNVDPILLRSSRAQTVSSINMLTKELNHIRSMRSMHPIWSSTQIINLRHSREYSDLDKAEHKAAH